MSRFLAVLGLAGILLLNGCANRLEDPFYRGLDLEIEPSFNTVSTLVVEKGENPLYVEVGRAFRSESYLVCEDNLSIHVGEEDYLQVSVYAMQESLGFCSDSFDFIPFSLSDDEIAGLIGIRIIDPIEEHKIYTLRARN